MTFDTADQVLARPEGERRTDSPPQKRRSAKVDQVLDDSFPVSDPPSWTGAISHVAAPSNRPINDAAVRRVRAEFLEMPGLSLTLGQAQRLWGLEGRTCEALLNSLIDSRFLRRTDRGLFVLCGAGR
jgi:hypothetical protein